jgi:hypothetical protein
MLYLPYLSKNKSNNSNKKRFSFYPPHLSFSILFLLFHIFFIHPISLPSSFSRYFSPFLSLPLSHFAMSIPHILNCLSLFIAHSAPSFLSFHPIPVFFYSFPHLNSFALSLPRYFGISFVIHLSYSLLYLDSLILSLLSYLSVSLSFHSALHASIFLFLSTFALLHWHTRYSGSISLSPSSPCSFSFLSSIALVFGTLPFHPFCPQTLLFSFVTWRFSVHP